MSHLLTTFWYSNEMFGYVHCLVQYIQGNSDVLMIRWVWEEKMKAKCVIAIVTQNQCPLLPFQVTKLSMFFGY